mgnify:FL=1
MFCSVLFFIYCLTKLMTMSASASTFITASFSAVTTTTAASFSTHHFYHFLNFFISGCAGFYYFTFKSEIFTCMRMVQIYSYSVIGYFAYGSVEVMSLIVL